MNEPSGDITELLVKMSSGDEGAESRLMPLVYDELRRVAAAYMRRERPEHTLEATALVHEAFLRLKGSQEMTWQNRSHFFAVAARVMRHILVDHARSACAQRRGSSRLRLPLESVRVFDDERSDDLLALDEALDRLSKWDPRQGRVIEMRFFGGLTMEEIAVVLGVSKRTVTRDFEMARAWLFGQLTQNPPHDRGTMGPT